MNDRFDVEDYEEPETELESEFDTNLDTELETEIGTAIDTNLDTELETELGTEIRTKLNTKLIDNQSVSIPALMSGMPVEMIRESLMSDEFLDFIKINTLPLEKVMTYYQCAIMEIETKFKVLNEQFSLSMDRNPIETIKSRVKSPESIMKKIRRRKIDLNIDAIEEKINDIAGVRVICSFPDDIYMLADCLLQQDDITLVERKDYIKNPKPSGYRSLHLIVQVPIFLHNEKRQIKVEVQLRTIAMDFWASLEHDVHYKKSSELIPIEEGERLSEELRECAYEIAQLDLRMQNIRDRIGKYDKA